MILAFLLFPLVLFFSSTKTAAVKTLVVMLQELDEKWFHHLTNNVLLLRSIILQVEKTQLENEVV